MKIVFPESVKVCLWSYDVEKIDLSNTDHRFRVIHNVLDIGMNEAVIWLLKTFSEAEITETIIKSNASDWSKKSLALWSLIFNVYPAKEGRFT